MNEDSRNLLILYATETGSAQDAADRIARQCRRVLLQCRVLSMDAYSLPDLLSENLVIFVVSTTGSGAEPRTMTSLWNMLLRSDLPSDLFEALPFAVFGLGDTAYEKFCWPAKKLARRMESLGATEICSRGEGDEQHLLGIDGALDPWMDQLLETLLTMYPLPAGVDMVPKDRLPPARISTVDAPTSTLENSPDPLGEDATYHTATVKCNERITAEGWFQDVRHLEFNFEDDVQFEPGDVAVIHPEASSVDVEAFLSSMGWGNTADNPFTIKHTMKDQSLPDHLPQVATLRTLFTRYLDFNAVPRRSFFLFLRYFTTEELEREKLDEFLSSEGANELHEYCYKVRRTVREVLTEFRQAKIPKEYVFDIFPPMRPRQFSIANSIQRHPRQIHLCVAIVRYRTKLKIPRRGVCTMFLASLRPGDVLRIGIQKGLIKLPADIHTPLICVGPGTGIAPMRSVVQDRIHAGSSLNTLYFGCRSSAKDHHYNSEWMSYVANANMSYRVACSRDGPEGVKRTYVQDLIREDAERVWELVGERGAWLLISGSSNKMPAAVKDAIKFAVEKCGRYRPEAATEFISAMERDGRLIEECWS